MARAKETRRTAKLQGKLADLSNAARSETLVVGKVEKHLVQQVSDRDQSHIHPSEMAKADWCPRQTAYRISGKYKEEKVDKKFSMRLENIFAEGHQIHQKWQNWLRETGDLWGTWGCRNCDHVWKATAPGACPNCNSYYGVFYKEVPLDGKKKYLIAGHADGAIWDEQALIEIKSIGLGTLRYEAPQILLDNTHKVGTRNLVDIEQIWKDIRRPFSSHLRQGNIYLALAQAQGLPFDKMVYVYESKAHQAFKEFVVPYSKRIAEPLLDTALDIKYAVENDTIIGRPEFATSPEAPVCKACPFRSVCWEGKIDDTNNGSGAEISGSEETASIISTTNSGKTGLRKTRATPEHNRPRRRFVDGTVRSTTPLE